MVKLETRDEFIKGISAGSIGALGLYFFVQTFYWLGLIKYGQSTLAGEVVFDWQPSLFMNVVSFVENLVLGAFFGIILAFLFSRWLTSHYYLLKGVLYGFALWVLNLGIVDGLFKYPTDLSKQPLNLLIFFFGYTIYGVIAAYLLKRLGIFRAAKI